MRRSICAQSAASTPPAPALMFTMAGSESCSPDSIRLNSMSAMAASTPCPPSSASRADPSSAASSASSIRTRASDSARTCFSKVATSPSSCLRSRKTFWAASRLSQNPGAADCSSSAPIRCFLPVTSKMPPELVQLLLQAREVRLHALDVEVGGRHVYPPTIASLDRPSDLVGAQPDQLAGVLLERDRVVPGEAGGAPAGPVGLGLGSDGPFQVHGPHEPVHRQIAQAVAGHVPGDLLDRVRRA